MQGVCDHFCTGRLLHDEPNNPRAIKSGGRHEPPDVGPRDRSLPSDSAGQRSQPRKPRKARTSLETDNRQGSQKNLRSACHIPDPMSVRDRFRSQRRSMRTGVRRPKGPVCSQPSSISFEGSQRSGRQPRSCHPSAACDRGGSLPRRGVPTPLRTAIVTPTRRLRTAAGT